VDVIELPTLNVLKDSTFCNAVNYTINWNLPIIHLRWLDGFIGEIRIISMLELFSIH
jgi:hypothetical protein